jgi:hypothetical protein
MRSETERKGEREELPTRAMISSEECTATQVTTLARRKHESASRRGGARALARRASVRAKRRRRAWRRWQWRDGARGRAVALLLRCEGEARRGRGVASGEEARSDRRLEGAAGPACAPPARRRRRTAATQRPSPDSDRARRVHAGGSRRGCTVRAGPASAVGREGRLRSG